MRKITVTPDDLEACALRIDEENQAYVKDTDALFSEVDQLGNAWHGRDNLAFVSQISGFQNDFRQISMICTEYSEFLKSSARSYRSTQDELVAQAARLER